MTLQWKDAARNVILETAPHDKCIKKVSEIFELVKQEETKRLGQDKIESASAAVISRLHKWLYENSAKIKSAHFTIRDGCPLFLAVTKGVVFDEALQESIVAVDMEICSEEKYRPLTIEVLLIPGMSEENIRAFTHPKHCLDVTLQEA